MKSCAILVLAVVVFPNGQLGAQSEGKIHELKSSPSTVHRGFYDATLKPVLTIDSGDRVRVWTTTGNPRYFENLGVPKDKIPAELYAAFEGVQDSERGDHTLIGPMYVNGAEPGDMLEIKILSVDVWLPIAAQSFRPHQAPVSLASHQNGRSNKQHAFAAPRHPEKPSTIVRPIFASAQSIDVLVANLILKQSPLVIQ